MLSEIAALFRTFIIIASLGLDRAGFKYAKDITILRIEGSFHRSSRKHRLRKPNLVKRPIFGLSIWLWRVMNIGPTRTGISLPTGVDRSATPLQLIELRRDAVELGPNLRKSVMRDAARHRQTFPLSLTQRKLQRIKLTV